MAGNRLKGLQHSAGARCGCGLVAVAVALPWLLRGCVAVGVAGCGYAAAVGPGRDPHGLAHDLLKTIGGISVRPAEGPAEGRQKVPDGQVG